MFNVSPLSASGLDSDRLRSRLTKASSALLALLAALPASAFACSLIKSPEFDIQAAAHGSPKPPQVSVRKINFAPWISDSGTCDGVGFLNIELAGLRSRGVGKYGVFIRVKSGVNDEGLFPDYALAPTRNPRGEVGIWWPWTGISPDADGHVRWQLELVPVSRSGVLGEPVPICVASDDSCPKKD